jgi:5-methyltetrahydropteroyltriglutamate--homocysteine methyltransferase
MSITSDREWRILTTYTGPVLQRSTSQALRSMRTFGHSGNEPRVAVRESVVDLIHRQGDIGIDVLSNGETARLATYATGRLSGLERIKSRDNQNTKARPPTFPVIQDEEPSSKSRQSRFVCTGPIKYVGQQQLSDDLANLKAGLKGTPCIGAFVSSISPLSCLRVIADNYYGDVDRYLFALAEALREEYLAIVAEGFQVQIEDPIAALYMLSLDDSARVASVRAGRLAEVLNHALRDIPQERIRHHAVYGPNMEVRGDKDIQQLLDIVMTIKAGFHSFELPNIDWANRYKLWTCVKFPDGKMLMPNCIGPISAAVEKPERVAARIVQFSKVVGRERVMASADFRPLRNDRATKSTDANWRVPKLQALVRGAELATKMLWK